MFSRGIGTYRDEWVYDLSREKLTEKMRFFVDTYQRELATNGPREVEMAQNIKWDRELNKYLERKISKAFDGASIKSSLYRPYFKTFLYFDKHFNGMLYQWLDIHNPKGNKSIAFSAIGNTKPFHCLATDTIADLHLTGDSQCFPLYRYDKNGNRLENITDWGLQQFRVHYEGPDEPQRITKEAIFHYAYAVLHHPAYRTKYESNLKREFPRIPFYENFWQWANWGQELMVLHLKYEKATPYPLERIETVRETRVSHQPGSNSQANLFGTTTQTIPITVQLDLKVKLKANKEKGIIELDEQTSLKGIPSIAWEYKLGNRSALEWVLDQYKEKKPSDPTIAEQFNTYRFADYKEQVIDLLGRVCTVSAETMWLIGQMPE